MVSVCPQQKANHAVHVDIEGNGYADVAVSLFLLLPSVPIFVIIIVDLCFHAPSGPVLPPPNGTFHILPGMSVSEAFHLLTLTGIPCFASLATSSSVTAIQM